MGYLNIFLGAFLGDLLIKKICRGKTSDGEEIFDSGRQDLDPKTS